MTRRRWAWAAGAMALLGLLGAALFSQAESGVAVVETVLCGGRPVSGVTVRIQGRSIDTTADEEGRYTLSGLSEGVPVTVSAWKDGYYCAKADDIIPPATVRIQGTPKQTVVDAGLVDAPARQRAAAQPPPPNKLTPRPETLFVGARAPASQLPRLGEAGQAGSFLRQQSDGFLRHALSWTCAAEGTCGIGGLACRT